MGLIRIKNFLSFRGEKKDCYTLITIICYSSPCMIRLQVISPTLNFEILLKNELHVVVCHQKHSQGQRGAMAPLILKIFINGQEIISYMRKKHGLSVRSPQLLYWLRLGSRPVRHNKCLSWNCHGLGNLGTVQKSHDLCS